MLVAEGFDLIANWLKKNGKNSREHGDGTYGPLNGGYDAAKKRYEPVYHEINGYAISCFLHLYRHTNDKPWLSHAIAIGDYLISTQNRKNGEVAASAFSHSLLPSNLKQLTKYYAFDNGMIVSGLMDLYETTKEQKYYEAGRRCIIWLTNSLQMSDGAFHSYYDSDSSHIWHGGTGFDKDRSVLHAKITMPLLRTWKLSHDRSFLDSADALLDWSRGLQADDGAFWSNEYRKCVFTHSHCYALEGFLYAYFITQNPEYLDIVSKGVQWLSNQQLKDGSVNYQYKNRQSVYDGIKDRFLKRKTTDASAQAARLWLLVDAINNDNKYRENACRALAFLLDMQCMDTSDINAYGGLYYRRKETILGCELQPVLYAWCAQFAVQAFLYWQEMESGELSIASIKSLF